MKKILSVALSLTIMVMAFAGCSSPADSTPTSVPSSAEPIKIAVAAPMTGDNAEYGIGFYNAATLMAENYNNNGGVLGRPIKIVQYDDKNSPEEAASIAQKIVSERDIAGVIGHFASGVCMVAAPVYQQNSIIPSSTEAKNARSRRCSISA